MPIHTPLPTYQGERQFAQQVAGLLPDADLWFDIKGLSGVRNLDVVLLHRDLGLWVIEVKAVSLSMVAELTMERCRIVDPATGKARSASENPAVQANEATKKLMDYVRWSGERPWAVSTAAWSQISRSDWNNRFRDTPFAGEYSQKLLFKEDLEATSEVLLNRLRTIRSSPPVGQAPRYQYHHAPMHLQALRSALSFAAVPAKATAEDLTRLESIEREARKDALKLAPVDATTRLLIDGYPSTGKTFKLLAIAVAHAQAGRRVLVLSYNKVLIADLRRLIGLRAELDLQQGSIDLENVDGLLASRSEIYDTPSFQGNEEWDAWAAQAVENLRSRPCERAYDTVLIDEAQDMKQWSLRFADWLRAESGSVVIAEGKGQSIYGERAPWLIDFKASAQHRELRRVFRNTRATFAFAHAIYAGGLNEASVRRSMASLLSRSGVEVEFDRDEPVFPRIQWIDESSLAGEPFESPLYAVLMHDLMVREYRDRIRAELESLGEAMWPIHLLVLVPDTDPDREYGWAREALQSLVSELPDTTLLDYCDQAQRLVPPRTTDIRLCTYHSSRGIEANRVVVLGLESQSRRWPESFRDLAFVALSRARRDVVVVLRSSWRNSDVAKALEAGLNELYSPSAVAQVRNEPPQGTAPPTPAMKPMVRVPERVDHERERAERIERLQRMAAGGASAPKETRRRPSDASPVPGQPGLTSAPVTDSASAGISYPPKGSRVRSTEHGEGSVKRVSLHYGYAMLRIKFGKREVELRWPSEGLSKADEGA